MTDRRAFRIATIALAALVGEGAAGQDAPVVGVLQAEFDTDRPLEAGQAHRYRFSAVGRQHLFVLARPQGIDVSLTLFGPTGERLVGRDERQSVTDPEFLTIVASPGEYLLEVRSTASASPPGRYELAIDLPADSPDRTRTDALEAYFSGEQARFEYTAEGRRVAREKFARSLEGWRSLGDARGESRALHGAAIMSLFADDCDDTLKKVDRLLVLHRAAGRRRGEATALGLRASCLEQRGEQSLVLDAWEQALAHYRAIPDAFREGWTLLSISGIYADTGRFEEALATSGRALALFKERGDVRRQHLALNVLGVVCERTGRHQQALDYYAAALPLTREDKDPFSEALLINNIGIIHFTLGDPERALELHLEAHEKLKDHSLGPRTAEFDALVLSNAGRDHEILGDLGRALEFHGRAVAISREKGAKSSEAVALQKTGFVQEKQGDLRGALASHERAHALFVAVEDRPRVADTIRCQADVHRLLGDTVRARELYRTALEQLRGMGDRKALAATLLGSARAWLDAGELEAARADAEAALELVEELRTDMLDPELRATYVGSVRQYYEVQQDVLMRLHQRSGDAGFAAAALRTSERSRARVLIEALAESRAAIRQGVEPELIDRERDLRRKVGDRADRVARATGARREPAGTQERRELDAALEEYRALQQQIRSRSPRYAALTQPQPLDVEEIRAQVLDDDVVLVEYSLGERRSFAWTLTRTTLTSHVLPPRAEIEIAARSFREALTGQALRTPTGDVAAGLRRAGAELGRMILAPVAAQLPGKRLLIVAEGALQYVAFAALPSPNGGPRGEYRPLIVDHEIISAPSASVVAILRRETVGRAAAPKALAVLADPVFRADDPRVASVSGSAPAGGAGKPAIEVVRSASQSGVLELGRLVHSRREAESIFGLARADQSLKALDFAADKASVVNGDLAPYRIVHFATHGFLNSQHPELSGLALSLVDRAGRPQDGFLRLHDVFNLRLQADLVVLSACQTALGKDVSGEGLIGLTRGFMYAGAQRVVASLWRVEDGATAELMARFYRQMLGANRRPAAALREAQLAMWRDPAWRAPQHWAGFALLGEWR